MTGERETAAAPRNDAAAQVVTAYAAAAERPVLPARREALATEAAELIAAGYPVGWLCDRARELPARGWVSLTAHVERSPVPLPGARQEPVSAAVRLGLPEWCGECGDGNPAARTNAKFRTANGMPSGEICLRCHPQAAQRAV